MRTIGYLICFLLSSSVYAKVKPLGLEPEQVNKGIQPHRGQIRACYERALKAKPTLGGKLVLKFDITAAGNVVHAGKKESNLRDPELEKCILYTIEAIRFPKSKGTTHITAYPLFLNPEPDSK